MFLPGPWIFSHIPRMRRLLDELVSEFILVCRLVIDSEASRWKYGHNNEGMNVAWVQMVDVCVNSEGWRVWSHAAHLDDSLCSYMFYSLTFWVSHNIPNIQCLFSTIQDSTIYNSNNEQLCDFTSYLQWGTHITPIFTTLLSLALLPPTTWPTLNLIDQILICKFSSFGIPKGPVPIQLYQLHYLCSLLDYHLHCIFPALFSLPCNLKC